MTNWSERAAENMIRLSQSISLGAAMREWGTTGGYEDTHSIAEVCELCEHDGLRYQYEIENRFTHSVLWVGSTCITKFVPLFEAGVEVIGDEAKANLLRRRQAAHEAHSREERASATLAQLAVKQPKIFSQKSWHAQWKNGYSARQLILVSVACKKDEISFNAADFRINTRREAIVRQVMALEPWQYRRMRGALPKSRLKEFDAVFGPRLRRT
jgi:hypothetical protein